MKRMWILINALLLVWGLSPGVLRADGMGTQAELGDLNNDGSVDAVLCIQRPNVFPALGTTKTLEVSLPVYRTNLRILMNDGSGIFADETAERLPDSGYAETIELEDVDGDGDLDILGVTGVGINCYLNDGTGKFILKEASKPPAPPRAQATATPVSGPAPLTVQFSSAGSVDPDGGALTYQWDFGDGASSDEANPTHVYNYNSEYEFRKDGLFVSGGSINWYSAVLTVTDTEGKTGSAKVMVLVRQPIEIPNRPPNILREWQGETSSVLPHWGKNLVIKTAEEWKKLWVRGYDGNGEKIYDGPPTVDFETEMALYVSAVAPCPGSRSIKITKIIQTETEIVVSVQIKKLPSKGNAAAVLAYPYHAIVIEKSSLPVRFIVNNPNVVPLVNKTSVPMTGLSIFKR